MQRKLEAARNRMRLCRQRIRNEQRQDILERDRQRQRARRAAIILIYIYRHLIQWYLFKFYMPIYERIAT